MELRPILPSDPGLKRTIMAADRTLMAWIRTSLSMLSFGFTIYKALQALTDGHDVAHSHSPHRIGLTLVGMGVFTMVVGTIGYWTTLRDLERLEKFRMGRPVLLIALAMSIGGTLLFSSIAAKLV